MHCSVDLLMTNHSADQALSLCYTTHVLPPSPSPGAVKRQFNPSTTLQYTFLKSILKLYYNLRSHILSDLLWGVPTTGVFDNCASNCAFYNKQSEYLLHFFNASFVKCLPGQCNCVSTTRVLSQVKWVATHRHSVAVLQLSLLPLLSFHSYSASRKIFCF